MKIYAAILGLIQAMTIGGGMGAPAYLSLPHWEECTSTKDYGTWQGVCVPKTPPAACDTEKHRTTHRLLSSESYNIPSC
ncbi:unnamed protein product [Oikopleura dioica]|uniref:Secreted protein n=1 Tax=Oikopleura dioica TaxID=34765 RepID=E4X3I6_OIKDI|nr:unnamed protein product [Oikopleura dioica]